MKIKLNRDKEYIELNKVIIEIDGKEFRISESKFKELCINKWSENDTAILIKPSVSNEILIL